MIGKTLAQYEITDLLGQGGMGVVYRATDTRLGRPVAIKMLSEDLAKNSEFMMRFEREARTLAALNHSNIASIYGIEESGGHKCLVLEYVDGETLDVRIARGPLRVSETLELGAQIAHGLAAAHDAGFIHRDLKPANVKITSAGVVKLLDFGLARIEAPAGRDAADDDTSTTAVLDTQTRAGTILGTLPYMSPEQTRGAPTDRRTDVWSLGVVLYECLTGISPFARESAGDCIAAILNEELDLEMLPASTPGELRALIRRCVRKDPQDRQRDAADCRLVLEDAREALRTAPPTSSRLMEISERRFRISDALCRELDREGFDPLLLGWEMRFADNNRDSDVLIVWIPSIGGDHNTTQWRELIAASRHRMVIVTPVGMEPGVSNRPVISLENQFAVIRALTKHLRSSLGPRKTIISGFSCGSIMALRCAAGDQTGELYDGVLAIDPDVQERDCFITRLFAGLDASSVSGVIEGLRTASTSCGTIDEWLVLHQHMIEWVGKVQDDISPLIVQGRNLSEAYEGVHTGADSPFVGFLRDAMARAGKVRCFFHDSSEQRRILGEIRMLHLDRGLLGPDFTDEVINFLPVPNHAKMMSNERLLEQLDQMVEIL